MGAEAAPQALDKLAHGVDGEPCGCKVDRPIREVEGRQLEQAVAVVGDDVLDRSLCELASELS